MRKLLEHELALIGKLKYEPYFLTVRDIVTFAHGRGDPLSGAGVGGQFGRVLLSRRHLGQPELGTMVFERFVSEARDERPISTWISNMNAARR